MIPARRHGVTGLWKHVYPATAIGLLLRLLFVLRFPLTSGDTKLYLQLAQNWLEHHIYGIWLNGRLAPSDIRVPGYPAFLAMVSLLFGRSTRAIVLSQVGIDLAACFLTVALAASLAPKLFRTRTRVAAVWLAMTCPFVANYTATVLTEVLATFLTTAALLVLALSLDADGGAVGLGRRIAVSPFRLALLGALLTGIATLVRPEMPLLLGVAVLVHVARDWRMRGPRRAMLLAAAMSAAFLLPLLPWAARNFVTLREVQALAPRYSTLPGEYAPVGYYAWTKTWLVRYSDVYLTLWKLSEEPLNVDDLPARAFDSPEEHDRVSELVDRYNESPNLDLSPELDEQFAQLARERTKHHPWRTYVWVPLGRALTLWFTPRTELLPVSGSIWPLAEKWEDSHLEFLTAAGFGALNYFYFALALGGTYVAFSRRDTSEAGGRQSSGGSSGGQKFNRWGIVLIVCYLVVRTAFLTTVEAPEPRYLVTCYPALLALGALLLGCPRTAQRSSSGSG